MLESRRFPSPEAFVHSFMQSLTPGIIPRSNFMHWVAIAEKVKHLKPHLEFFTDLSKRLAAGADFVQELTDSLLAADDPLPIVRCAFELLGHTSTEFVTKEDDTTAEALAERFESRDELSAKYFAEILRDLGFVKVLEKSALEDLMFGVQIGLETHRRKNIGGDAFKTEIELQLKRIAQELAVRSFAMQVHPETKIKCKDGLSKTVDFALLFQGRPKFGIEVNFYTVTGSKPTEIKRSYGDVTRRLFEAGVELIWVTDGKGYRSMNRSLRDAYVILPNIYNLKQVQQHFSDDLVASLRAGPKPSDCVAAAK